MLGDLVQHYPNIILDAYVIMPNHIHGVIIDDFTREYVGAGLQPTRVKQHGLSEVVRGFKSFSSRRINELCRVEGAGIWQRSFYDRIIRDEKALHHIREYIYANPERWAEDQENPLNVE